jgi:hydrogenase expression/formation protein HypD
MLVRQVNAGRAEVENEFRAPSRARATWQGAGLVAEVFELRESFEWRGLGEVPYSALRIRPAYAAWDAERKFGLPTPGARPQGLRVRRHPARRQAAHRLQAVRHRVHARNPMGSCMVSNEGACAAHYAYGRFKDIPVVSA